VILLCLASNDYAEKYKPCIQSQQEYCERQGYTYRLVTGEKESRNWKRAKVEELEQALVYEDVCLIDADCLIKPDCPPFSDFLTDKSIYYANGKSGRLNSGFLYFKNTCGSSKFIAELKDKLELPVPANKGYFVTSEGENGHIIWLKAEYEERNKLIFQEISNLWNCSLRSIKEQAYILHFTNSLRKEIFKYK
jgi:hypothetical protein